MTATRVWSPRQEAIFEWFRDGQGNLVVEAFAGTGKSTTMAEGVRHARERQILMVAYNKDIANDMRPKVPPNVQVATMHAMGLKYLKRIWPTAQLDKDRGLWLLDKACDEMVKVIGQVLVEVSAAEGEVDYESYQPADALEWTAKEVLRVVSLARRDKTDFVLPRDKVDKMVKTSTKALGMSKSVLPLTEDYLATVEMIERFDLEPDEEWQYQGWSAQLLACMVLRARELAQVEDGKFDFDDMMWLPVRCEWIKPWFDMVVVDEAQDSAPVQLEAALRMCRRTGRIVVCGDARQAIYAWRGADSEAMERLRVALNASVLPLNITYRCPKVIVKYAQQFVPTYEAAPEAPEGEMPIRTMAQLYESIQPGDAVLSRLNAPLMGIALRLLKEGRRACIQGRDIGQGLIAVVRNMKARSIPDFLQRLQAWRDRQEKRAVGDEEKMERIKDQFEVLWAVAETSKSTSDMEARLASLFVNTEDMPQEDTYVVCSSVHRFKGKERNRVWGLMSTIRNNSQEERNIHYVMVTRAKQVFFMVKK